MLSENEGGEREMLELVLVRNVVACRRTLTGEPFCQGGAHEGGIEATYIC